MAEEFLRRYPPVKPPSKDAPSSKYRKEPVDPDVPKRTILFLGDEGVGKTTFIRRYCEHMHDYYGCETCRGTFNIFTQYLHYWVIGDTSVPVRFLDLPARLSEESRRDQYPNFVNLVVLCFAIDQPNSLENVWRVWLPEFRRYLHQSTRFHLLGLKSDMRLEMEAAGRTPVSAERAKEIHQEFGFNGDYKECSVEANPQHARSIMELIISETIVHDAPGIRRV